MVLGEREIAEMPHDPTVLLDELRGPAGSTYAELFVDGFSGDKLPSRDSIRRDSDQPESLLGGERHRPRQRRDPGVEQARDGQDCTRISICMATIRALNAGNPFAPGQPGYYAYGTGGWLSGPLNHRASYFGGVGPDEPEMNSAVDAQTLDANLNRRQ